MSDILPEFTVFPQFCLVVSFQGQSLASFRSSSLQSNCGHAHCGMSCNMAHICEWQVNSGYFIFQVPTTYRASLIDSAFKLGSSFCRCEDISLKAWSPTQFYSSRCTFTPHRCEDISLRAWASYAVLQFKVHFHPPQVWGLLTKGLRTYKHKHSDRNGSSVNEYIYK